MADQLQLRGGSTAEHSTFTGALREVTVDIDKDTVVVHDNATAGGHPLLREDLSNLPAGTIDNADINASAAIAGTKIDPDFGSQTVETTGVFSAAGGAQATPSITFTGDTNTGIYSPGADQLAISTAGSGRLFVDASGNIGVGTASPAAKLDVNGKTIVSNEGANPLNLYKYGTASPSILMYGANGTAVSPTQTLTGDVIAGLNAFGRGSSDWAGGPSVRITAIATENNGGTSNRGADIKFETVANGGTSLQERLRLTSAGLVGIGTSSPGYTLDVNGNGRFGTNVFITDTGANAPGQTHTTGALNCNLIRPATNSNASYNGTYFLSRNAVGGGAKSVGFVETGIRVGSFTNDLSNTETIKLNTNGSATFAGSVGIGTTTPSELLHIRSGSDPTIRIDNTDSTSRQGYITVANTGDMEFRARSNASDGQFIFYGYGGTADSEKVRIDSSGKLLVGTSSSRSVGGNIQSNLQIEGTGTGGNTTSCSVTQNSNTADGPRFMLAKSRSTSNGGVTVVQSGDSLGIIDFAGADGTDAASSAVRITAEVDGTPGSNDMPGRLVFSTTADGASTPTKRVTIDSSGRVGIGTTSPDALLNLSSSGNGYRFKIADTTNNHTVGIYSDATTARLVSVNNAGNVYEPFAISGADVRFWIGSSEKARIDTSGRLLVGTSTVSTTSMGYIQEGSAGIAGSGANILLAKKTTVVSNGASLGTIYFSDSSQDLAGYIDCARDAGTWTSGSSQPTYLRFATTANGASSPTERMRIGRDGLSQFYGTLGVIYSRSGTSAGTAERVFIGYHSASSIGTGTISVNIYTNGNITNANNSYGGLSDIKLKENIVNANSQWDDLKALRVRNYNLKEGETHTQIGLVAQEAELVSPGLVTESPDRDDEGNDLGTVTKSVNYSVLYMKAVKALQEAMERIETLEAKVAALETP